MTQADRTRNYDRVKASVGVAALHALLGYVLVVGLGFEPPKQLSDKLKVFNVLEPPPPPIEEAPAPKQKSKAEEGEAAPPNLRARPTPAIAPSPKIQLKVPPPIVTAPVPSPLTGSDRSAGNADIPGPGSGSGGVGRGTGSGGQGLGSGGGGGMRAQQVRGGLADRDYPRSALRDGAEGIVSVRYQVGTNGRVSRCAVIQSSGHAALDAATCRLIERRFEYRPARNVQGRPVTEMVIKSYNWQLPFRN
jgi:periplasmic protein TonB